VPKLNLPLIPQALEYTCGAACFESMYLYFHGKSPGELFFAKSLGTLELGYTDPQRIVKLAKSYGLQSFLKENGHVSDLRAEIKKGSVVFVTWWDEDSGHYSLINELRENWVELMDPWLAREKRANRLELDFFLNCWALRGSKFISVSK
jgi:predicted double-glycine peptidase